MDSFTLDQLPIGSGGTVKTLTSDGIQRRRMLDLGLVEGAFVKALHQSPSGDPTAYAIMGAVIALRKEDAKQVILKSF